MADYATLKAAIQAVIYENGNQEITGSVMQATLLAMVNSLGANYQYAGIATPSTNPGTPDQNVFYLASTAGTYVNFGNIVLAENEVAILKYNGSWTKETSGFASAEKVNQLEQENVDKSSYSFVLGTISGAGAESVSTTRCRSGYLPVDRTYTIKSDASHDFSIRYYNEKRDFQATSGSWVKELSLAEIDETYVIFRIVARNSSDGTISDVSNFPNYITIEKNVRDTIVSDLPMLQSLESLFVKRIAYNLVSGKVIDARIGTTNFGKSLNQSGWGASQYVELQGAKYIRLYRNISSTITNPSYSGVIFFDKDMNPMSEGVSRIIYGNGGISFAEWTVHEVPAGAVWMRVSVTPQVATTYQYGIELYAIAPNNVAGLQAKNYTKTYDGEKVDLSENTYEWRAIKSVGGGSQSAAIYGKYVVFVNSGFQRLILFDMETMMTLATCNTGVPVESILHCNQSQFGTQFAIEGDLFPVLYTCAQNNEQGRCEWRAYRIIPSLTNGEVSSFTVQLVQTIYLPIMTDNNALGNANIAVDYEREVLWSYSRNNNEEAANYNKAKFTKFAMPLLSAGAEVTLSDADILDSFDTDWSMYHAQGAFLRRGKLYIAQGMPSDNHICLRVIDLYAQRQQVTYFDLLAAGITVEPEGVYMYDGHIWIHNNAGVLYRLDIG